MSIGHKGSRAAAQAWARVHLVQGQSEGQLWDITSRTAGVRLDVGSSPTCTWCVQAPGVRQHAFVFFWDGEVLWASDLHNTGDVQVDGQPLIGWRALTGRPRLHFGQAVMVVETSATAVFERAAAGPPTDRRPYETSRPPQTRTAAHAHVDYPTGVIHTGAGPPSEPDPIPTLDLPPMPPLDTAPASYLAGREMSPSSAGPPRDPNATQVLDSGALELPTGGTAPLPRPGVGVRRLEDQRRPVGGGPPETGKPPLPPRSSPPVPPTPPRPKAPPPRPEAPPPRSEDPPPRSEDPAPHPEAPPTAPSPSAGAAQGPRFAPPPPPDQPVQTRGSRFKEAFTPRTRVLLMLATIVAGLTILLGDDPPPERAAESESREDPDPRQGAVPPAVRDGGADAQGEEAPPDALALPVGEEAAEEPAEDRGGDPAKTLEGRAAAALMSGRLVAALRHYRELASNHPDRPEFTAITEVLEQRLTDRCRNGVDQYGRPCRNRTTGEP